MTKLGLRLGAAARLIHWAVWKAPFIHLIWSSGHYWLLSAWCRGRCVTAVGTSCWQHLHAGKGPVVLARQSARSFIGHHELRRQLPPCKAHFSCRQTPPTPPAPRVQDPLLPLQHRLPLVRHALVEASVGKGGEEDERVALPRLQAGQGGKRAWRPGRRVVSKEGRAVWQNKRWRDREQECSWPAGCRTWTVRPLSRGLKKCVPPAGRAGTQLLVCATRM